MVAHPFILRDMAHLASADNGWVADIDSRLERFLQALAAGRRRLKTGDLSDEEQVVALRANGARPIGRPQNAQIRLVPVPGSCRLALRQTKPTRLP